MNSVAYATGQFEQALELLQSCLEDVDARALNWAPGGTCNSIGKTLVHVAVSLDFFVGRSLTGDEMVWPRFAETSGWPANPLKLWTHEGPLSMEAVNAYIDAVAKASRQILTRLTEADLERSVDTGRFGARSAAWLLQFVAVHTAGHAGEIAAVKGMQGMKGLPI